ncbi:MAG: glycosyltransferase family 2 protein [Planctomycetes bacterium]|nr:glycosyltransferase family 2 protein [Planctomycetota bacterium]
MLEQAANTIIETLPSPRTKRKLISICTPAYNEKDNVEACYRAVKEFFETKAAKYDWEWILTDNHSTDGTFEKLKAIAVGDPRVRGYRFSRNFGYQLSIHTGYMHALGDAAVQLDCDLEDPPAIIAEFLRLWEEGNAVVYGIRRTRQEPWLIQRARRLFYWGLDKISEDHLPRDVGDFRLVDRRILDELRRVRDPHLYLRGRIATMGFKQAGVPYDRHPRTAGVSKFNFWRLCSLALDATLSHSVVPLRIATFMGLALCGATLLLILGYAAARLVWGSQWPAGFTTTVVLILLGMGINGLFLGIIGEYLARIYQHLKGRSEVIVMETAGLAAQRAAEQLTL